MLEYYRGILFLTTNRLSVFGVAFQSRIHLTLHYPELNHASRRSIWKLLLQRVRPSPVLADEDLYAIAKAPMNGRQIKNAVKAAQLLATEKEAVDDQAALTVEHVNIVLRVMPNSHNQA